MEQEEGLPWDTEGREGLAIMILNPYSDNQTLFTSGSDHQ